MNEKGRERGEGGRQGKKFREGSGEIVGGGGRGREETHGDEGSCKGYFF